jgi:hypothetical protein
MMMGKEQLKLIEQGLREAGVTFQNANQEGGNSLLIPVETGDCLVELYSDGRLSCQFGVDMEELRTLLAGDTTEDIAEDELQRVARDHLRPMLNKYRSILIAKGFEETIDTTEEYYAISFIKSVDQSDRNRVIAEIQDCLKLVS